MHLHHNTKASLCQNTGKWCSRRKKGKDLQFCTIPCMNGDVLLLVVLLHEQVL